MNRLEGGRDSPEEQPEQGSLSAEPLLPKQEKGRGSNTSREAKVQGDTVGSASEATRGDSGGAAEAASTTAATVEKYPSYIRREKSTTGPTVAVGGGCNEEAPEEAERETEKGYEGGDRVRLLVGSFNVGNSPLTVLAPWLPYGGKGFDLIVIGLQESTYKAPRAGRDSPFQRTYSLSPTNSLSPVKTGGGEGRSPGRSPAARWAEMHGGEDIDGTHTPPSFGGRFLTSSAAGFSPLLSPFPLLSSSFLRHKRRGSSGGVELRATAAA
ncbi:unnamed protein product, partial [Pylaiella littoralis]